MELARNTECFRKPTVLLSHIRSVRKAELTVLAAIGPGHANSAINGTWRSQAGSRGRPIVNEFNGEPFHIALARPSGSFEFTYAEIGLGKTSVMGEMEMSYGESWAHFCVHHFNQDGMVRDRSRLTAWLGG